MYLQVVTAGANPVAVKKGIDKTCEHLLGKLKENAVPVKGSQDIKVCLRLLQYHQQAILI